MLIKRLIVDIFTKMMGLLPLQNKVVFDNFCGKGYGDNPKYISEALLNEYPDINVVWVSNCKDGFPHKVKIVRYGSLRSLYEYRTAKVWVDNVRNSCKPKKRRGQYYIQTWHAPFSPKRIEKDAIDFLGEEYINAAKKDGSITDLIISNSKMLTQQYVRAFWLNSKTKIFECGLPRNDYIINNFQTKETVNELRKKLDLRNDDYVVLYAPTFRDNYSMEGYNLDYWKVIEAFEKKFQKDCVILLRMHPNIRQRGINEDFGKKLIDVSSFADSQMFAVLSDCVISDYSTILFDFALQMKPAFIFASDLMEYSNTRGLLPEFYKFPFSIAKDNMEMVKQIESFDYTDYTNKMNTYLIQNPTYDDGTAATQVAGTIFNYIMEGRVEH